MLPSRILITGFTGFVGSHLAQCCHTNYPQAEIFGLYNRKAPLGHGKYVTPLQADITQANEVDEILARLRPDLIFHLAAQSSVALSWSGAAQTLRVNGLGALHLLEAVRQQCPHARVLLIGSGEQYGTVPPHDNPIHEDYALRPNNPYAVSKVTQDLYGYQYFVAYGLPVLRIRAFNHFGPGQAETFAIASLARQIALIEAGYAEPIICVGNLQTKRDFLAVEDVACAYLSLADRGHPGEAYNVGSGKAHTIQEILDYFLRCVCIPIQIYEDPSRQRLTDTAILEADITRIQAHTGWRPTVPLRSALDETLNYWRDQVASGPS